MTVNDVIELDGKILTGKPYIKYGKNPWVSGEDFPQPTHPLMMVMCRVMGYVCRG